MLLAGLTGSIGMGKSTIASRFCAQGVPVCDADAIVHSLYQGEAVQLIEAAFPGTTSDGKVDRKLLSAQLMANPQAFIELENIVHPLVHAKERDFLKAQFDAGTPLVVIEVPLLFETYGDARFDVTIVVSAPYAMQKERVLQRPGMTEEKFEQILSRQIPDVEKRRRADFVLDTGQTLERSHADTDAIIEALKIRKGTAFQRYWSDL